jgi:hypothetical protein
MMKCQSLSSGDGGNRTRVRKIRPPNIYERSRLYILVKQPLTDRVTTRPVTETQRSLFRMFSDVTYGTLTLSRPVQPPVRERGWWTWSFIEDQLHFQSLMQREEEQRKKCDWHLIFCADFSSSAPLGSQFGASLSRRSLSSPGQQLYQTSKN